jgi:hypothetical protein
LFTAVATKFCTAIWVMEEGFVPEVNDPQLTTPLLDRSRVTEAEFFRVDVLAKVKLGASVANSMLTRRIPLYELV